MKDLLKTIWKNKSKIFEGVKNSIIKNEMVEEISTNLLSGLYSLYYRICLFKYNKQ